MKVKINKVKLKTILAQKLSRVIDAQWLREIQKLGYKSRIVYLEDKTDTHSLVMKNWKKEAKVKMQQALSAVEQGTLKTVKADDFRQAIKS